MIFHNSHKFSIKASSKSCF